MAKKDVERARLGDCVSVRTGKLDANAASEGGIYPFFTCSKLPLRISTYSYDCECVLVAGNGELNVKYYNGKFDAYQRTYIIESNDKKKIDAKYLYYSLSLHIDILRGQAIGGVIKYIKIGNLTELEIPLPTLDEQKRIAAELDKIVAIKKNAEERLEKLNLLIKARFNEMFMTNISFPIVKLDNLCEISHSQKPIVENKVWLLNLDMVESQTGRIIEMKFVNKVDIVTSTISFDSNCILYSKLRPNLNKVVLPIQSGFATSEMLPLRPKREKANREFLAMFLRSDMFVKYATSKTYGAKMPRLGKKDLFAINLPLPPLPLQRAFASFVEKVESLKSIAKREAEKLDLLYRSKLQEYFG